MSDHHYLDFYLNEEKIFDAYTYKEDEPYIKVNDIDEVISGKYHQKKEQLIKQISTSNNKSQVDKTVKFSSPTISNSDAAICQTRPSFQEIVKHCQKQKITNSKDISSTQRSSVEKSKRDDFSQFIFKEDTNAKVAVSVSTSKSSNQLNNFSTKRGRDNEMQNSLPPTKRFLKKWMSQLVFNPNVQPIKNDMHIQVDFSPKVSVSCSQLPVDSVKSIKTEIDSQFDPTSIGLSLIGQTSQHDSRANIDANKSIDKLSPKITNFFQPTQRSSSSQTPTSSSIDAENKENEKFNFNYFKPPEVIKIEPDSRIQNNRGYQVLVDKYSDLFQDFQHFNEVQIRSISPVFESNDSLILKGPTGSSKSTVLEFSIIKLMHEHGSATFKVLMIESMKLNCTKKVNQWQKFSKYGLNCCSLTDDGKLNEQIENSSLIIGTPEKIEMLTRDAITLEILTRKLKLVLIDELQIMEDEKRGQIVEGLLCRLKIVNIIRENCIRYLATTATVGDLDSMCDFFGPNTKKIRYSEDTRSVPLEKHVIGFESAENYSEFKFDKILTNNLINVLKQYQNGQQAIIYVSTRKIAEQTAEFLRRGNYKQYVASIPEMIEMSNKIGLDKLKECMLSGVGYHHGGLTSKDKSIIEKAYKKNLISILCCTTSLSIGANLSSNVVIIKGTFRFVNSKFVQYNETEINQLIGRAGLKTATLGSKDSKAIAIIMTKKCNAKLYDSIVSDKKPLKSRLRNNLCELINTEIILDHLKSFDDVLNYVKLSYLYVCLRLHPDSYGIPRQSDVDDAINRWIKNVLEDLKLYKVITSDDKRFTMIGKTPIGLIMNGSCTSFQSIKRFSNITTDQSISSLLFLVSQCKELSGQVNIRNDEKSVLSELNKGNKLKFPIRNKSTFNITDSTQKINCLIQAHLGGLLNQTTQQNFIQEANHYVKIAKSLARALVEYLNLQPGKSFSTFRNAILLSKSLHAGIWYDSTKHLTKQIPKIGVAFSLRLDEAGYTNFEKLRSARAIDIESYCNRQSPFGEGFVKFVSKVPKYKIKVKQSSICSELFRADLIVSIELENHEFQPEGDNWLIVGDEENNLLFAKKISVAMFDTADHTIEFEYQVSKVKTGLLKFNLINEFIVGADDIVKFTPSYRNIVK